MNKLRVPSCLFKTHSVKLNRAELLRTGGNSSFCQYAQSRRSKSKHATAKSVHSVAAARVAWEDIHVGRIDYVSRALTTGRASSACRPVQT
jgi:myo-inositol-1-phosphate synthase